MVETENASDFGRNCISHLEDKGITGWRVEILQADQEGAKVVIE